MRQDLESSVTVLLGVVVARERIDHPWRKYSWSPVSVFLDAKDSGNWRLLTRSKTFEHYHAATLPLELNRRCAAGYRVNLANGVPSIYVLLRDEPSLAGDHPIRVQRVTASPFEVQTGETSVHDIVGRVAMPDSLITLVRCFLAASHADGPELPPAARQMGRLAAHSWATADEPAVDGTHRLDGLPPDIASFSLRPPAEDRLP